MFARKWVSLAQVGIGAALGAGLLPLALPGPGGEPPRLAPWGVAALLAVGLAAAFEGAAGRSRPRVLAYVAAGYAGPFLLAAPFLPIEDRASVAWAAVGSHFAGAGLASAGLAVATGARWLERRAWRACVRGCLGSMAVAYTYGLLALAVALALRRPGEPLGSVAGVSAMLALMAVEDTGAPPPGEPPHRPAP